MGYEARCKKLMAEEGGSRMGVQLIISMDEQGRVSVTGPIGNKLLCYGMLKLAEDAIRDFKPEEKRVVPVPAILRG